MADEQKPKGLIYWVADMIGLKVDFHFWEGLSGSGFIIGYVLIFIYAWGTSRPWITIGVLALLGFAAWVAGAVLGFVFGVPRLRADPAHPAAQPGGGAFVPNTNLEQISDWLTKIIVGATLVQLRPLADAIGQLATAVGAAIGSPGAAVVSGAVMVLYFAGGFMWGYLECSLRVFSEMSALVDRLDAAKARQAAPAPVPPAPVPAE
jgi:hypothetical protein